MTKTSSPEIDDYVAVILGFLGKLYSREEKVNIAQEIQQHLNALISEEKKLGKRQSQAIKAALQRFGDPWTIGKDLRDKRRTLYIRQGKITPSRGWFYVIRMYFAYAGISIIRDCLHARNWCIVLTVQFVTTILPFILLDRLLVYRDRRNRIH